MRQYDWDEYYEKFFDWAESTQQRNLSYLTSLGDADEVAEIIIELQGNPAASNRLLKKAVESKIAFSGSDLAEIFCFNDKALAFAALRNSVNRLTSKDLEDLYDLTDDEELIEICKNGKCTLPSKLQSEDVLEENISPANNQPQKISKTSLLGLLAAVFGVRKKTEHQCDGDCANCPEHYGYRYGRWYYGHGHTHGCEFGGNSGNS